MSDSPKYSTPRISRQERERIKRERAEQAARERALRQQKQEEERRRREAERVARENERRRQEEERRRERERQERLRLERLAAAKSDFRAEVVGTKQKTDQLGRHQFCDDAIRVVINDMQIGLSDLEKKMERAEESQLLHLQKKLREFERKVSDVERLLRRRASLLERIGQRLSGEDAPHLKQRLEQHFQAAKTVDERNLHALEEFVRQTEQEIDKLAAQKAVQDRLVRMETNFNAIDPQESSMDAAGYASLLDRRRIVRQDVLAESTPRTEQALIDLDADVTTYRRVVHELYDEQNRQRQSASERTRKLAAHLEKFKAGVHSRNLDDMGAVKSLESLCKNLQDLIDAAQFDTHQLAADDLEERMDRLKQKTQWRNALELQENLMAQFVSRDPACAFDSAEQNALENTIRKLHREIDAENFDVVSQNIGELRDRIRIHLDKTVEWKNGQIRIAAHWREMLLERETELSTLLNDEAVSKWARPELELGGEQLSEIKDFLEKSEFVEIERRLAGWDESLASLLKEIEEVQLKEAQRQFIVDGFKNILGKMGFVDVHASLENGENPFSATIIEARRDPGKTLSILVPQKEGGDIRYVVDGYDKRQRYHQGSLYRTCDEAQAQLQGFHDQLKEVGIEMSTLTWREMPPHDLEAAADSLPREQAKTFSNER